MRLFLSDIRLAGRAIARMPGVAATVVLSLAAGIGANVIAFSWLEARVFRPVPGVADAASLHTIDPRHRDSRAWLAASWLEYEDLARGLTSFDGLMAFRMTPFYVGDAGDVERPYGLYVSETFFEALGVVPVRGRAFLPGDTSAPGATPVVVISHGFWESRFGAAPDVVGRSLRVNGVPLTVVGVTPAGFQGPVLGLDFQLWVPATMASVLDPAASGLGSRRARDYTIMGRLADGVTRDRAAAEVTELMRELERRYPDANGGVDAEVLAFWDSPRGPQRMFAQALLALQAIMALLLVAVCGTVATVLLARASRREREMAVRAALGGSRARLARLVLAESALLSMAGAALGTGLAFWGARALWRLPITAFPIRLDAAVTPGGLALAGLLGLCAGLACGAPAAVRLARTPASVAARGTGRLVGPGRLARAMTGAQIALAMLVLVIAALFLDRFAAASATDPGFRRDGLLLMSYDLAGRRPDSGDVVRAWTDALLERAAATPGVAGAAISSVVPLDIHGLPPRSFVVEGRARDDGQRDRVLTNVVSPGYFEVAGIKVVEGRGFSALADTTVSAEVVVNEAFVDVYLDDAAPVGRAIEIDGRRAAIVGVATTTRYDTIDEAPTPAVYLSWRDRPLTSGELHLATAPGREHAVAPLVREALRGAFADVPLWNVRSMTEHIDSNLVLVSVPARMFSVLGPLLLLLAASGVWAVVSHAAAASRPEIGIRLALGATPGRVVRAFVGASLRPVAIGALGGWSMAVLAASALAPGVLDPAIFAGVPALLVVVAAAAAWWPAWMAATAQPAANVLRD